MKKLIIINLPMTVKEIGDRAFKNCTDLTTITISGVKYIGDYAFKNCNKLKNVVLPDGVEYIGKKAFAETVNIDNSDNDNQLHFPNGTSIGITMEGQRSCRQWTILPSGWMTISLLSLCLLLWWLP